ncbi:MAG TPA: cytochrome P450 [Thermoanaerobaculia bacterium]|jgi:unspecific monooxygenase|nr:cytochrome P450 [Thermoanaerobaculia bacterium]
MKPSSEIPRPAGSVVAHSLRFAKNALQFYEEAFRECGDIFTTRIPGLGNWVYVCSPDLANAMLEAPPDVLAAGEMDGFSLSHLLGRGATSQLDGPAHQERRDVTSPHLGAQGSLRHVDDIRRITERRVAEWPLGTPFPLVAALQKIALESLITVFFSGASPDRVRQLADLYETFSFKGLRSPAASHPTFQIDLGPWSPWGRVKQRQREVIEAFSQEIEARLAADPPEAGSLIAGMARARLKDGSGLSREVIRAEILDLLFQGHELTGDSMTWTMGELLTHPEVLARLRQELDSRPDPPYLEAVIHEGLRRRPSNFVTSARRVKQPFPLGGYLLPEGTMVAICYPALGMREDLFPDPKGFDPDRFYGKTPVGAESPFGGGPHACAGKNLAMVVMKTGLATIVRKAELKLAQDEIRPVRKAYYYEPNEGLRVILEKRF